MVSLVAAGSFVRFSRQIWRPFHGQEGDQGTRRCLLDCLPTYWWPARQEIYRCTRLSDDSTPRGDRRRAGDESKSPVVKIPTNMPQKVKRRMQKSSLETTSLSPRHTRNDGCYLLKERKEDG